MSKYFDTEFCKGCKLNLNFLPCTVYSLPLMNDIQDIIKNNPKPENYMDVFVCPVNAQTIQNSKMVINVNKCKKCMLCYLRCNNPNNLVEDFNLIYVEKALFKSLYQMCAALNIYFCSKFKFYPEVNSPGNARDKRVDIVAKNDKTLYLIKVLKKLDKVGFYVRSYKSILNSISDSFSQELSILLVMLVPSTLQNDISLIDENTFIVPFSNFEKFLINEQ